MDSVWKFIFQFLMAYVMADMSEIGTLGTNTFYKGFRFKKRYSGLGAASTAMHPQLGYRVL